MFPPFTWHTFLRSISGTWPWRFLLLLRHAWATTGGFYCWASNRKVELLVLNWFKPFIDTFIEFKHHREMETDLVQKVLQKQNIQLHVLVVFSKSPNLFESNFFLEYPSQPYQWQKCFASTSGLGFQIGRTCNPPASQNIQLSKTTLPGTEPMSSS